MSALGYVKQGAQQIADHYGFDNQLEQTIEECSELILAIQKYKRDGKPTERLKELMGEVADVSIMIIQLKYLLGVTETTDQIEVQKVERQLKRIEGENKNEVN